jgi:hypothetical protein
LCLRHQSRHRHRSVGDWLANNGVFGIAITGKPVSYGICVRGVNPGIATDL